MSTTKKCPLREIEARTGTNQWTTCIETKCAWWDSNNMECAVLSITQNLKFIHDTVEWAARLHQ